MNFVVFIWTFMKATIDAPVLVQCLDETTGRSYGLFYSSVLFEVFLHVGLSFYILQLCGQNSDSI